MTTEPFERKLAPRMFKLLKLASGFRGVVFRNVGQRFANRQDLLSTKGCYNNGGRYNLAMDFGVLYLSCDLSTCLSELEHAARYVGAGVHEKLPRTFTAIQVDLTRVLDLTDSKVRRKVGVPKMNLMQDWFKENSEGREAVTQIIGRAAKQAGFDALLVPSARSKGKNLNLLGDGDLSLRVSVMNIGLLEGRRAMRRRRP